MSALVIDGPRWWARAAPDKTAATWEGQSLTYAELGAWSKRIAVALQERGVTAGDRVGIVAGNSLAYCALAVGILEAGAVAVPMSTRLTPSELGVLAASSEPRLVAIDETTREAVSKASADTTGFDLVGMDELDALREGESAAPAAVEVDPDDPAALIYTSGTTGTPKGVIFTHRTILGFIAEWGLTEPGFNHDMRVIMALPLGGAPGLIWGIVHTFVRGGTLVLHTQFNPAQALASLERDRITVMLGVPVLFEQIAAQPGFGDADLSAWQTGHVGGARVSEQMLRAYADKGVLLRQIYGMTEAGGSTTATPREAALTRPECCGIGNMFTRVRTVRDDGSDCDPGEPGEILIRGPSVTPGYWRNPEATQAAFIDGWLRSGDLGAIDEDGYLRMVDRMKDLIITGGLNVAPAEIENVIAELAEVEEVAVIAAEDEKFGETPAAVVRLRDGLEPAAIVAHCNERLADFKVPRYVILAEEPLPRMASGKVAKRILREAHPDIAGRHERLR